MIEVTIKTLDCPDHTIRVDDDTTLYGLKQKVLDELGIAIDEQRLIFFGRVLSDNNKKLAEYGVNGKVVHLVSQPPPRFAQATNEDEDMDGRQQLYDANRGRTQSPTRGRIRCLQRSVQEIRSLMDVLTTAETWTPPYRPIVTPLPNVRRPTLPATTQTDPNELQPDSSSEPGSSQPPARRDSTRRRSSDRELLDDSDRITDPIGVLFEPRQTVTYSQRYVELQTELMELETQFIQYRAMYIEWIRRNSANQSAEEVVNAEELEELLRRKEDFSTLISEMHHTFAHAHHLISEINYSPSTNRLFTDTIVPHYADMPGHINTAQPNNEWDATQPTIRYTYPVPYPYQPVYRQPMPHQIRTHQPFPPPQYHYVYRTPARVMQPGFQVPRAPCRIHTQRTTYVPLLPQQPYFTVQQPYFTPYNPYQQYQYVPATMQQHPMPQQTAQVTPQIARMAPQPQMPPQSQPQMPPQPVQTAPQPNIPSQPPQQIHILASTGDVVIQPVQNPNGPLNTAQVEQEARSLEQAILNTVANHCTQLLNQVAGFGQTNTATNTTSTSSSSANNSSTTTSSASTTTTQSQGSRTTQGGPQTSQLGTTIQQLGPIHLGTFNLGTINLGHINLEHQMDTQTSNTDSTQSNQNANQQPNQANNNQARRVLLDFDSLFRGLQQVGNLSEMEIVMSLEPGADQVTVNTSQLPTMDTGTPDLMNTSAAARAPAESAETAATAVTVATAETVATVATTATIATAAPVATTATAAPAATAAPSVPIYVQPSAPPPDNVPNQQGHQAAGPRRYQPISSYIYDPFLPCNSRHAVRQVTRRRERREELRRAREREEMMRDLRESHVAPENDEALEGLVRVNRPVVFSDTLMSTVVISFYESTIAQDYVSLNADEFDNLRRVLLIGLRRLRFMCESDSVPITATTLANYIIQNYSNFIDDIDSIARIRSNVDVTGSIHCLISTYMPALCALLQRTPNPTFVFSHRQLFSGLFYNLSCILVHICKEGYEGFKKIVDAFIERYVNSMENAMNRSQVEVLIRASVQRVRDHIQTSPSDPHQFVMRADGLACCICESVPQGNTRPMYQARLRDMPIEIQEDDIMEAPPYAAPRVGHFGGNEPSRSQEEELEDYDEDFGDGEVDDRNRYVDTEPRMNVDTDDDSDAYVAPIMVPGVQMPNHDRPTAPPDPRDNYQQVVTDPNQYVSFVQPTYIPQNGVNIPILQNVPRGARGFIIPQPQFVQVPYPQPAFVQPAFPRPAYVQPVYTTPGYQQPGYTPTQTFVPDYAPASQPYYPTQPYNEVEDTEMDEGHEAECTPPPRPTEPQVVEDADTRESTSRTQQPENLTQPKTTETSRSSLPQPGPIPRVNDQPGVFQASEPQGSGAFVPPEPVNLMTQIPERRHSATSLYPVISLPPPPDRPRPDPPRSPDTRSPATKRMRQGSPTGSKRQPPRGRAAKSATNDTRTPNEPSSSEDAVESNLRNSMEEFPRQWLSVLEEDAKTPPHGSQPQEPLSDAYLAGMTPRRRRREQGSRPPLTAAAFIEECVSSVIEGGVQGANDEQMFVPFSDYCRAIARERVAANVDFRPVIHRSLFELVEDSLNQDKEAASSAP